MEGGHGEGEDPGGAGLGQESGYFPTGGRGLGVCVGARAGVPAACWCIGVLVCARVRVSMGGSEGALTAPGAAELRPQRGRVPHPVPGTAAVSGEALPGTCGGWELAGDSSWWQGWMGVSVCLGALLDQAPSRPPEAEVWTGMLHAASPRVAAGGPASKRPCANKASAGAGGSNAHTAWGPGWWVASQPSLPGGLKFQSVIPSPTMNI